MNENINICDVAKIMFKSMRLEQLLNVDYQELDKDILIALENEIRKKYQLQTSFVCLRLNGIELSIKG